MKKSSITKLKNLGEVSEKMLNSVDIFDREDIEKLGPVNIYHLLKAHGYLVNPMTLYVLQGAIMDCHWKDVPREIKEALKKEAEKDLFEDLLPG